MVEKTYWRKYKAAVKGYQYSGKGKKRQTAKMVEEKYRVKRKGLTTVIKELKQRILAEAAKISWYEQRFQQYRIERLKDSKWIKRKFTTGSMDKQGVVTETYPMLKKVGHFGVEYEV